MLANMVTTLFILPPLLWFILFKKGDDQRWLLTHFLQQPKLILQATGAALLPLLAYAYVFVRGAQHPEWRGQGQWPSAWAWFVDFMTIQQGRDELAPGLSLETIFTAEFPALMWQELTLPVFACGLLGLVFLGRRRAILFYSTLAIYFVFCWGYRFGNWFQVIIPAYPIFTIGFGALLGQLSNYANERIRDTTGQIPANGETRPPHLPATFYLLRFADTLLAALLVALLLFNLGRNWPAANQQSRPTDTALAPGWAILADAPQSPALIAASFEERLALQYIAAAWGAAPGIAPVDATTWSGSHTGEQALYVSRNGAAAAPQLIDPSRHFPQAVGRQLIELQPTARTELPSTAQAAKLNFGDTLNLVGWETPTAESWQVALYWQAARPIESDFTVSVRPLVAGQLISVAGNPAIQDHQPVWGTYPTSRWQAGEIVRDVYAPELPVGIVPDAVQIVVYQATATGFENLAEQTLTLSP
jgi:hypothetical protein